MKGVKSVYRKIQAPFLTVFFQQVAARLNLAKRQRPLADQPDWKAETFFHQKFIIFKKCLHSLGTQVPLPEPENQFLIRKAMNDCRCMRTGDRFPTCRAIGNQAYPGARAIFAGSAEDYFHLHVPD